MIHTLLFSQLNGGVKDHGGAKTATIVLDIPGKVFEGEIHAMDGFVKPAKPAPASRIFITLFTSQNKHIPNLFKVAMEYDGEARTVTVTAFGRDASGELVQGSGSETF